MVDLLRSRWLMLVAGIWIQITMGSTYVFGLYSESLKRELGFDQSQLDTLGFFKGIGANVGIHTGLLLSLALPPWIILALGAGQGFLGYFMIWLAGTHRIRGVQLWQMCAFMLVAANSQTYSNTAVVVTSVTNFPTSRGTVIGLMKGCLGLSGAILTFFYRSLCGEDGGTQIHYTLFAAVVPTVVCVLLMLFIRPVAPSTITHDPHENTNISRISGIIVALAFGLIPLTLLTPVGRVARILLCVLLLLALASPLLVAFKASRLTKTVDSKEQGQETVAILLGESSSGANFQEKPENEKRGTLVLRSQDFTLSQAFASLEFWLLVTAMACGMGSGATVIDNVNQLGSSLGYSTHNIAVVVSLVSIWNFLGRFGAGALSDFFLRARGVPRPAFNSITLGVMAAGHLVLAAAFPGALYVGTLVVGLCYGSQWSLMPATVSEIFGMKEFGTLFNTIAVASPLGAYILSVRVAGYFYDREAQRQQSLIHGSSIHSPPNSCHGPACFRLTFLVLAGVCLLGCVCTSLLVSRTRKYYKEAHKTLYHRKSWQK
ncbi:hypothetical protein SELMODRAFT_178001 [Selaginella moellendorffii]|uniref:Uncharacterized protein n=2 Tax=Selaginella moellendorffii TaxID=88036 RepID=D8S9D2_SELML|nr:protein NUCLEAR FUSION DEFECTIVE 4 [Selaginella moellendorffii]XP_024540909.1 protein NUCLEAR FUSION DEFECTIVE 4 [Selaginella moellendorffii]EFJ18795.1 hypothetical protein SELMODRAFT_178001 [Selaginella moellendorffii]|eukprot:XP_002979925.1 protein NUCLEAR FUSION DEFECTIVE 4 [Selaginella moellendorffii]